MKQFLKIALIFCCVLPSCSSIPKDFRISVTIPQSIGVSESEVRANIANSRVNNGSSHLLEITIFYFNAGTEVFSYTGKDNFSYATKNGSMRALLRFKSGNKLGKVFFLEADGGSKKEILERFGMKLNQLLE